MFSIKMSASVVFGLEAVVQRELRKLGCRDAICEDGRVHFEGDVNLLCRANLWLRSAERVFVRMGEFGALSYDDLFEGVKALEWQEWLPANARFPVECRCVDSKLMSMSDCQSVIKKAIVEKLSARYGRQWFPEDGPRYKVECLMLRDRAALVLDTSGTGLHKRGYRTLTGEAPIRETIAAGMVQLSGWSGSRAMIDPFCGSGTIPLEAAMIGSDMAPGLGRRFDAEEWLMPALEGAAWSAAWKAARQEAEERRARGGSGGEVGGGVSGGRGVGGEASDSRDGQGQGGCGCKGGNGGEKGIGDRGIGGSAWEEKPRLAISGFDRDEKALELARYHAGAAGLKEIVHFQRMEMSNLSSRHKYGCIICNPPYGERMGEKDEVEALYREMGKVFRKLDTWSFFVLTPHPAFEKLFGRKADRRRKLYNGGIACQFYQFFGPQAPKAARVPAIEAPLSEQEMRAKGEQDGNERREKQ